ncbi:MAG: MFS transporter [Micropepsaceae bacterium]
MKLIGLVGIATLLGAYDLNVFGLAAKQVLAEFGKPETATGTTIALMRLGVFGALILCLMADVIGRRKLLLFTILGMALSTLATAFAPNYETFVAAQIMVRIFGYTEDMLCIVVIAEEFEERSRGWAISTLGALSALGGGVAVIVFALVAFLPYEWRAIYFIGAMPLLLLAWMRRGLPETQRFAEAQAGRTRKRTAADTLRPLIGLFTAFPGRIALVIAMVIPFALGSASTLALMPTFLQNYHGFTPGAVGAAILGTGIIGMVLAMWVGRLSDRVGRRPIAAVWLIVTIAAFAVMYTTDSTPLLIGSILFGVFGLVAVGIQIEAVSTELFPTESRATAQAVRFIFQILAGGLGLYLHGALLAPDHGFAEAVLLLMIPMPLALIPLFFIPETAGRSLEDITAT